DLSLCRLSSDPIDYAFLRLRSSSFFFFSHPAPTQIYTLSLHDALPISSTAVSRKELIDSDNDGIPDVVELRTYQDRDSFRRWFRSEEHTSELQSQSNLVCRLLLEKKKNQQIE